jgi:hypothetical protein
MINIIYKQLVKLILADAVILIVLFVSYRSYKNSESMIAPNSDQKKIYTRGLFTLSVFMTILMIIASIIFFYRFMIK